MKTICRIAEAFRSFTIDPRTLAVIAVMLPLLIVRGRVALLVAGAMLLLGVTLTTTQSVALVLGFLAVVLIEALANLAGARPAGHPAAGGAA
ncbi:hypothetical protein [Streptomyces sp. NPDC051993]|uniref:hypothetical protein n=1 Tax=Streptomyces sp. NPDC051993 TaxID=3155286 RepID=UPI0034343F47